MTELRRIRRLGLAFYLGLVGVGVQVLYVRAFMSAMGGSELSVAVVLGSWLAWTGIGSFGYNPALSLLKSRQRVLIVALFVLGVLIPTTELAALVVPSLLVDVSGQIPPPATMLVAAILVLAPVCAIQGLLFTAAASELASTGRVYLWEALGSALAGFVTTIAVAHVPEGGFCAALTFLTFGMALWLSLEKSILAGLLVLVGAVVAWFGYFTPLFGAQALWRKFEVKDTFSTRSGLAVVLEQSGEKALMLDGQPFSAQHGEDTSERQLAALLSRKPYPSKLLVTGGSLQTFVRAALKLKPLLAQTQIWFFQPDYALIDAEVKTFAGLERLTKSLPLKIVPQDLRTVLRSAKPEQFKGAAIWIRTGDPLTLAQNRFLSKEFFCSAADALGKTGRLGFAVGEAANYLSKYQASYLGRIGATAHQCFRGFEVFPFDKYFFVFYGQNVLPRLPEEIWQSLAPVASSLEYVSRRFLDERLEPGRVLPVVQALNKFKSDFNTDKRPVSVFEALALLVRKAQAEPKESNFFLWGQRFASKGRIWALVLAVLIGAGVFLATRALPLRKHESAAVAAVSIMGFTSMTAEIAIVFAYQTAHGLIYTAIGALIAAFMLGMAAGTAMAFQQRSLRMYWIALLLLVAPAGYLLPFVEPLGVWGFGLYLAGIGFVSGAIFQSAAANVSKHRQEETVAALLNGFDHFGAAAGGFLAGLVLFPILGIDGVLLAAAALMVGGTPFMTRWSSR